MAILPMVCVVTDAQRNNINKVWAARGKGLENFIRRLCPPEGATTLSPATHWLMSDATASDTEVAICQAMTNGVLPDLPFGVEWGVEGVISEADALVAVDGANFHVYSVAGDILPTAHVAAVLATEGLIYVPEEEI